jgi:hypothetical protein
VGWPTHSLRDIPAGDYWIQALFQNTKLSVEPMVMPMDQGEGQKWAIKPGNLYSKSTRMHIVPQASW